MNVINSTKRWLSLLSTLSLSIMLGMMLDAATSSASANSHKAGVGCNAATATSLHAGRPTANATATDPDASHSDITIASTAAASDEFSTLVTALEIAGLTEVLAGDQRLTVFAPTNAAFEALPEGTLDALLLPENRDQLIQVLTYHVVAGEVTSDMLSTGPVETAAGPAVQVELMGQQVTVNNANVVMADILASNGVIHAVDQVLLPPAAR